MRLRLISLRYSRPLAIMRRAKVDVDGTLVSVLTKQEEKTLQQIGVASPAF